MRNSSPGGGDLFEVDAERGFVTILQKANEAASNADIPPVAEGAESSTERSSGAVADKGVVRVIERAGREWFDATAGTTHRKP